jgi:hypothetical protein
MCILAGHDARAVIPEIPEIGSDAVPDFARAE